MLAITNRNELIASDSYIFLSPSTQWARNAILRAKV